MLRFNKHILNELAEGLKHLPNLEGVSKGDSLYINEDGNPTWGSSAFIPTFENAAYGIEWTKNDNDVIRIGNAKFHRELPIKIDLKVVSIMKRKSVISLILRVGLNLLKMVLFLLLMEVMAMLG